ncbi:MAG: hypothetical protein O2951_00725 [Bacteroidetes bacterium]|nr:hypothetical protein [Bacteroidota bacterium]
MLSNQFKEDLVKIYELKPYVNLLTINEQIALNAEKEALQGYKWLENTNQLIKQRDFGRSFYIPY